MKRKNDRECPQIILQFKDGTRVNLRDLKDSPKRMIPPSFEAGYRVLADITREHMGKKETKEREVLDDRF